MKPQPSIRSLIIRSNHSSLGAIDLPAVSATAGFNGRLQPADPSGGLYGVVWAGAGGSSTPGPPTRQCERKLPCCFTGGGGAERDPGVGATTEWP